MSPSLRAAQLYESVRIRPVVVEEVMPQETRSTKSKAMSYEVNPESCHISVPTCQSNPINANVN